MFRQLYWYDPAGWGIDRDRVCVDTLDIDARISNASLSNATVVFAGFEDEVAERDVLDSELDLLDQDERDIPEGTEDEGELTSILENMELGVGWDHLLDANTRQIHGLQQYDSLSDNIQEDSTVQPSRKRRRE